MYTFFIKTYKRRILGLVCCLILALSNGAFAADLAANANQVSLLHKEIYTYARAAAGFTAGNAILPFRQYSPLEYAFIITAVTIGLGGGLIGFYELFEESKDELIGLLEHNVVTRRQRFVEDFGRRVSQQEL